MDRLRARFALFGLLCAFGGWALASIAQWAGWDLWTCMLILVGMLMAVTWAADRLTAPPRPSADPTHEPGA